MSKEILNDFIYSFDLTTLKNFFRSKTTSFSPSTEELDIYNDDNFREFNKFGKIKFDNQIERLIIVTSNIQRDLTERSSKKSQYEKAKKILRDFNIYDAGIFIFYDNSKNFRFSLVYEQPIGTRRVFSNFKRFTYYVSKELTNKTFLSQIGDGDFSTLEKIKEAFSVEKVTKEFFNELSHWYFWAIDKVEFPDDEDKNREIRNAKNLIRLITRIVFVWFMKVKKLIPETLFDKNFVDNILNYKDKTGSTYYKAILQNLFFATLNTQIKKDDPKSRSFIDEAKKKDDKSDGYLQQGYYRYERFIKDTDLFLEQFKDIPFLNGGLFDSLDKRVGSEEIRIDCFSDHTRNEGRLKIPDELFFSEKEKEIDLKKHLAPDSKGRVIKKVRGLLSILKSYNFTIDENTPVDEEVALDPELLGKVFENLLASYNPETRTTARKATGSYYTPREIVEYMVNESLIAYLETALSDNTKDIEDKLHSLLDYNIETNPYENEKETTKKIIGAIEKIKILDPACGSGAFPMGILHKLVLILHKLDPDNSYWKKLLLEKVPAEIREETEQSLENKPLDYIRKLGLIEHCIYGVDIQEIAIQISKLRFFISLLVEQEPDDNKPNRDIKSLPNLETKFVAANTLIGLEKLPDELFNSDIQEIIKELFKIREDFFYANSRWKKIKIEEKENKLKKELIESIQKSVQKINKEKIQELKIEIGRLNKELDNFAGQPDEIEVIETTNLFGEKEIKNINKTEAKRQEIKRRKITYENELEKLESHGKEPSIEIAKKIADFNPYDQNKSNSWFDPEWMFGIKDGFDIVIANPPYISGLEAAKIINESIRSKYKEQYISAKGTYDIFILFFEKGLRLLKQNSFLIYITPSKFLSANYAINFRQLIINKYSIDKITDFSTLRVFESAAISTIVTLFSNRKQNDNIKTVFVKNINFNENIIYSNNKNVLNLYPENLWGMLLSENINIITKIIHKSNFLENFAEINACTTADEAEKFEKLLQNDFEENCQKFVNNGSIDRYVDLWGNKLIKKNMLTPYLNLKKIKNERREKMFLKPKLIFVKLSKHPEILIDFKGEFASANTNMVYDLKNYNLLFMGGYFNSKLFEFIYSTLFGGLSMFGTFQFQAPQIRICPIPKITDEVQESFIKIIETIIEKKKARQETIQEEAKIDCMLYELYELTKEEIKIVERG